MLSAAMPAMMEAGAPEGLSVAATYMTGNWVISDSQSRANVTVVLTGNLIVQAGGVLELENTTLMMNCTTDGQFGITVQAGGVLYLNDTDGDKGTAGDATVVTNGLTAGMGFAFEVQPGAMMEARNSRIANCGLIAGTAGAAASGLRLRSEDAILDGMDITGCANGIIIDSCDARVSNCTVTGCLFNGVYIVDDLAPSHRLDLQVAGNAVNDNNGSGILAEADYIGAVLAGNNVSGNSANGIMLTGGLFVNATITANDVWDNGNVAGIGVTGSPSAVLRLDVRDNIVSDNTGTGMKFGVRAPFGTMLNEVPAHAVFLNASGNAITHAGDTGNGIMFVYASTLIRANITGNDFLATRMENGVHIGCLSTNFNLGAATTETYVDFAHNNLTAGSAGALRITSNGTLFVNMTYNDIYGTGFMSCGGVYLGWFQDDFAFGTAREATIRVEHNNISKVGDAGGLMIDAVNNLTASISNNTFSSVNGGAIVIGGITVTSSANPDATVCHNIIGSGGFPGIKISNPNRTAVFSNNISNRFGFSFSGYAMIPIGDGIYIAGPSLQTRVFNNTVSACQGGGVRLVSTRGVYIQNNTLAGNYYGISLDGYSMKNFLNDNTITKPSNYYGFMVASTALDHAFPASNTVNGESFSYFRGLAGTAASPLRVGDLDIQEPLMSTLGQVVFADCRYLSIENVTASNGTMGIGLYNTDNSALSGIRASGNAAYPGYGIGFQLSSDFNRVSGAILEDNLFGVGLASGTANKFWSNGLASSMPTRGGFYVYPAGNTFDNDIPTNNTFNGEAVRYFRDAIPGTTLENATVTQPLITNLGQVVVTGASSVLVKNTTMANGANGLYLEGAANASLSGCRLENNTIGVYARQGTQASLANCTVLGGTEGIHADSSSAALGDSMIANSTLAFNLTGTSKVTALNSTFERSQTSIADTASLTVLWYLDVGAYHGDAPLAGASVLLSDSSGVPVLDMLTGIDGTIPRQVCSEFVQTSNGTSHQAPYILEIALEGFTNHTEELPMANSTAVKASLTDTVPPPFNVSPSIEPAEVRTSTSTIWLNATLDDTATGNSIILLAEWAVDRSLPGSSSLPMLALDGAFDEQREEVTVSLDISSWDAGTRTLSVRGVDSDGNWSPWSDIPVDIVDDQGPTAYFSAGAPPATMGLSVQRFWANITFNDAATGGNAITAIEWNVLDRGTGSNGTIISVTMPEDGVFNEPAEDVCIQVPVADRAAGGHTLFARASDASGMWGGWLAWDFELMDDQAPSRPSGLWVVNTTYAGELRLIWTANTEPDLAGYNIYRSTVQGRDYEFVATLGAAEMTWTDTGLANDTMYYYVMTAFDNASVPNESPFSAEAGARTIDAATQGADDDAGIGAMTIAAALVAVAMLLVALLLLSRRRRSRGAEPPRTQGPQ